MRTGKTAVALLCVTLYATLCATPNLFALECRPEEVEVTGRVRLVGTSRFPSLVITGEERDWFVDDGELAKLMGLQQRIVTVRARKHIRQMVFANGLVSHSHHVLSDIVIVRVEGAPEPESP